MSDLFPPFAPDAHEPRKRLFKPVPFRVIAPNLITLIALCLGLTAIRLAYEGRLEPAVYAILVAAFLDGVDGRLARLLKGTSRFGAELDSLSDFLNFGVGASARSPPLRALPRPGARLDRGADLRDGDGAAAGALQRHAGRSEPSRMAEELLRRHGGAGRRDHLAAADLPVFPRRADRSRGGAARARLRARARVPDDLDHADLFGQDHGQARAAAMGAADLRRDRRRVRPARELPVRGAGGRHDAVPRPDPDRGRPLPQARPRAPRARGASAGGRAGARAEHPPTI